MPNDTPDLPATLDKPESSEVQAWLGKPSSTGVAVDRAGVQTEKWIYYYGSGEISGMERAHLKYLELEFGKHGRLVAYNWSQ